MGWIITIVVLLAGAFAGVWFAARWMIKDIAAQSRLKSAPESPPADSSSRRGLTAPEHFTLRSPYGYKLSCDLYLCEGAEKAVVLCHDIGSSKAELGNYVRMFLERGMSVLTFDQRGHGETGGPLCSFGYYEVYDVRECVNHLENLLGSGHQIGVWGVGMGAAAAAGLAKQDRRIRFMILDSCYAELSPLLDTLFSKKLKRFYFRSMLPFLSLVNRMAYGWSFSDVQPAWGIGKTSIPLLVIHGAANPLIGMADAYRFSLERKDARLVIFPKAEHGVCRASNPAEYRRVVQQFLISAHF